MAVWGTREQLGEGIKKRCYSFGCKRGEQTVNYKGEGNKEKLVLCQL